MNSETRLLEISNENVIAALEHWMSTMRFLDKSEKVTGLVPANPWTVTIEKEVSN